MIDVAVTCTQTVMEGIPQAPGSDFWDTAGDVATWAAALTSAGIALFLWLWNRKMVHDLGMQAISNQWQQFNMAVITDPKLIKLLAKEEKLSESETRELFYVFFHLTSANQIYLSQGADALDRDFGGLLVRDLLAPLKRYPKQVRIALNKRGYSETFARRVLQALGWETSVPEDDDVQAALSKAAQAARNLSQSLADIPRAFFRSRASVRLAKPASPEDQGGPPPTEV